MRVLIVEDGESGARGLLRLDGEQAHVYTAACLAEALSVARSQRLDAVLLNVSLPGADGIEAVRSLRAEAPHVPIVMLSETDDDAVATQAMQAGAQDYLIASRADGTSIRRALQYAIERQQLLERLEAGEARLQQENVVLRRLADAAGRVFAALDVRAVIGLLAAEARRIWGSVTLYALRSSGELVCAESGGNRPRPDAFLKEAFIAKKPVLAADRARLALPIPGTTGSNEWILDIRGDGAAFNDNDVFALELLRQYVGIAVQNVALFRELQSQRASVIQLNQLKDDLIALLAHDFKGPLTTIIGFTELLEQHALEGEEADGALRSIRQSAMRLANLANDTLALSRVEQGELNVAADPLNVTEIVAESVEALAPERRIELIVEAQNPVVRGDPPRLRQVFDNVIGNAIKYSPGGEPVEVRIGETENTVRVAVRDGGIGIPAAEMPFLFERFTRASNAKRSQIKGTGLGLYLAKTLVERHGGTIQVQSEVGSGSTFAVVLPRMRDGLGGMLRIQTLTADENLAQYVLHELRAHGYASRRDKTLTAAMERLSLEPADIIIVDRDTITAPAEQLFKCAASAQPRIGLVRIGGSASESGWDAVLPNPFLGSDLQQAVERADRARSNALSTS